MDQEEQFYSHLSDEAILNAWRDDQDEYAKRQVRSLNNPLWLDVFFRVFVLRRTLLLDAFDTDCRKLVYSWILDKSVPKSKLTEGKGNPKGTAAQATKSAYLPANKRLFDMLLDHDSRFPVPLVKVDENEGGDRHTVLMLYVFRNCYAKVLRSLSRRYAGSEAQRDAFLEKFKHSLKYFFGYFMRVVRNELFALLQENGFILRESGIARPPIHFSNMGADATESIPDVTTPEDILHEELTQTNLKDALREFLKTLDEKERTIIDQRYLNSSPPRTIVQEYPHYWNDVDVLYRDIDRLKAKAIKYPALRQMAVFLDFRSVETNRPSRSPSRGKA